jgi:hypothetical protein
MHEGLSFLGSFYTGTGEMCMSGLCMHAQIVHVTCTFQFCPIEGVLWGILYTYKNKSFIETCRHMLLSPTPTMAKNL